MRDLNFEERPRLISITDNDRLKPCPECGGKPAAVIRKNFLKQTARAYCRNCDFELERVEPADYEGDITEDIIAIWNEFAEVWNGD